MPVDVRRGPAITNLKPIHAMNKGSAETIGNNQ
jgi:hypothetical protein